MGTRNDVSSEEVAHRGRAHSVVLDLPPLAALVLRHHAD
jgi:hypothetical protein